MPSYYTAAYLVGDPVDGDFYGSDLMPKLLILQQEGNRTSLQVFYLYENVKPISSIRTLVPESRRIHICFWIQLLLSILNTSENAHPYQR